MSRYIYSVDIETTGLDPEQDQILEVAIIAFNLDNIRQPVAEMPRFHCLVGHDRVHGNPFAMSMHPGLLRLIADKGFEMVDGVKTKTINLFHPDVIVEEIHGWADKINGHDDEGRVKMQFAGKNVAGFDLQFLRRLPDWWLQIRPVHRTFDPAILYFKPGAPSYDKVLPDMDTCCKRAGLLESRKPADDDLSSIPSEGSKSLTTKHDAMGDAEIVVQLLQKAWL